MRWIHTSTPLALLLAVTAGCATDNREGDLFAEGDGSTAADDGENDGGGGGGDDGSDDGGGDGGDDGGGDGGIRLDVSPDDSDGPEGSDMGGLGCSKVDFLFVVDNSSSMFNHQATLAASFPGFITAITDRLETTDFHIMVVDTDEKADPNDGCGECYERCVQGIAKDCGFNDPNDSGAPGICNGKTCGEISPQTPDSCDYVLGAGVSDDRWEQDCGFSTGNRFIVDGQPDLTGTFECAARTGVYGTGKELIMGAMSAAVGINGPGQCNEGFVRDDAILVVTLLGDAVYEPGQWSNAGEPQDWYDALVAAKKGEVEPIVVLGLLNAVGINGGECEWPGASSSDYKDFVEMFGARGFHQSICTEDYAEFFFSSLDTIETVCDEFEPVG